MIRWREMIRLDIGREKEDKMVEDERIYDELTYLTRRQEGRKG